jgi:predicted RNase H-like HicB family nuclease
VADLRRLTQALHRDMRRGRNVKTYKVVYEMDESGCWIATVPSVKGCHTYGRSINEARERVREALALFAKDAARARLADDIRLPANVRSLLAREMAVRLQAEREHERLLVLRSRAVATLTEDLGLSLRDAGELLGISHQRVQQLREKRRTARGVAAS